MAIQAEPIRNRLLNAISDADLALLRPDLEDVNLDLRFVIERPHQPVRYIYFPESGFASVVAKTRGDRSIEVGIIGSEGMTGLSVVMGDDRSSNETFIQMEGRGWRMAAGKLASALEVSPPLRKCLLRYVQAFLCQTAQTVLANGRAQLEERLARWLLMAHDRSGGPELKLTHEFLALMLGVRRPGVTIATHFLEGRGLIKAKRSQITVVDRDGLEEAADGSYGVPEAEYARLFGTTAQARSA